jgi:hypothetical protein
VDVGMETKRDSLAYCFCIVRLFGTFLKWSAPSLFVWLHGKHLGFVGLCYGRKILFSFGQTFSQHPCRINGFLCIGSGHKKRRFKARINIPQAIPKRSIRAY